VRKGETREKRSSQPGGDYVRQHFHSPPLPLADPKTENIQPGDCCVAKEISRKEEEEEEEKSKQV